jgi:hypothetical protein
MLPPAIVLTRESDLIICHVAEAYIALLDLRSYEKDLPDWDYNSITRKILHQMEQERIFAWGCPEDGFQIRLTRRSPQRGNFRPKETARGIITTSGALCLTSYSHLTYCAQFGHAKLPQLDASQFSDVAFSVEPGRYEITVYVMFAWDHYEQFAKLNKGDNYTVYLRQVPAGRPGAKAVPKTGGLDFSVKAED